MKFTYEIKGVTLNMQDMMEVCQYYRVACTAEYLLENYDLTEDKAMGLAYNVRVLMDKYDYTEIEAIEEVMREGF